MDDIFVSQGTAGGYVIVRETNSGPHPQITVCPAELADTDDITSNKIVGSDNLYYNSYTYDGGGRSFLLPAISDPNIFYHAPSYEQINSSRQDIDGEDCSYYNYANSQLIVPATTDAYYFDTPALAYKVPNGAQTGVVDIAVIQDDRYSAASAGAQSLVICVGGLARKDAASVFTFYGPWQPKDGYTFKYVPLRYSRYATDKYNTGEYYLSNYATEWSGDIPYGPGYGTDTPRYRVSARTELMRVSGRARVTYVEPPHNNWKAAGGYSFKATGDNSYVVSGSRYFSFCGYLDSGTGSQTAVYDETGVDTPTLLYSSGKAWHIYAAGRDRTVAKDKVKAITCAAIPYYPLVGMQHLPFVVRTPDAGAKVVAAGGIAVDANIRLLPSGDHPMMCLADSSVCAYLTVPRYNFTPRVFTDDVSVSPSPYRTVTVAHGFKIDSRNDNENINFTKSGYNHYSSGGGVPSPPAQYVLAGGNVYYTARVHSNGELLYGNQPVGGAGRSEEGTARVSNHTLGSFVGSGANLGPITYTAKTYTSGNVTNTVGPGWSLVMDMRYYVIDGGCDCSIADGGLDYNESQDGWTWDNGYRHTVSDCYTYCDAPSPPCDQTTVFDVPGTHDAPVCNNGVFTLSGAPLDGQLVTSTVVLGATECTLDNDLVAIVECADGEHDYTITTVIAQQVRFIGNREQTSGAVTPELLHKPSVTPHVDSAQGFQSVTITWNGETKKGTTLTGSVDFDEITSGGNKCNVNESKHCTVTWAFTIDKITPPPIPDTVTSVTSSSFSLSSDSGYKTATPPEYWGPNTSFTYTNSGGVICTLENYRPQLYGLFDHWRGVNAFTPSGAGMLLYKANWHNHDSEYTHSYDYTSQSAVNIVEHVHDDFYSSGAVLTDINTTNENKLGADYYRLNGITGYKTYDSDGTVATPSIAVVDAWPTTPTSETIVGKTDLHFSAKATANYDNRWTDHYESKLYDSRTGQSTPTDTHEGPRDISTPLRKTLFDANVEHTVRPVNFPRLGTEQYVYSCFFHTTPVVSGSYLSRSFDYRFTREGACSCYKHDLDPAGHPINNSKVFTFSEYFDIDARYSSSYIETTSDVHLFVFADVVSRSDHNAAYTTLVSGGVNRTVPIYDTAGVTALIASGAEIYNAASAKTLQLIQQTAGKKEQYTAAVAAIPYLPQVHTESQGTLSYINLLNYVSRFCSVGVTFSSAAQT